MKMTGSNQEERPRKRESYHASSHVYAEFLAFTVQRLMLGLGRAWSLGSYRIV